MLKPILAALLTAAAIAGLAQVAGAQYMYVDTNGNGIYDAGDRLNANGDSTVVDIYLSTNTRRGGGAADCNSAPGTPMLINSYAFNLAAVGGVATYRSYINRQPTAFPNQAEVLNPGDGTYKNAFYSFSYSAAGLYRLGTLTITGVAGSPRIDIVDQIAGAQDFTSFGTQCPGIVGDNTYRLDGPNTRALYESFGLPPGTTGDWLDADGLGAAGGPNNPPVVSNPGNKTVDEQTALTFTVTATDPDAGQTLTYSRTIGLPPATGATINATTGAFTWTPTEAQGPGTYPVTVTATDDGIPALSGSAAIGITVNEVAGAPVLAPIGNKSACGPGVPFTFTATATDNDIPANTLTFSLDPGAPAGATINGGTGAFSWTPSTFGTFPVTVRVTDNGAPPLSDFEVVSITVQTAPNQPPVLGAIGNKTVNELAPLTFTATATDAFTCPSPGILTFTLDAGAPAGASINGSTGAFGWTPTEAQGPGNYPITVRVTDDGNPPLSDFETITVTVNEVNTAPVLASIGNKTGTIGAAVTFTVTATDADVPANTLTCSLDPGAPAGATIDPATCAFSWTPTTCGQFPATVRVTDNGAPPLSDSEVFSIVVGGCGNQPPVLAAIGNKTVNELTALTFTATATDPNPGAVLTFSLDAGAPPGATIGAATGAFSWTPTEAQGPNVHLITIRVTNNASPPLSDLETIQVTVNEVNSAPVVANPGNKTVNELSNLAFTVTATDADIPANTITWSLTLGTPVAAGATLGAVTGAFSWIPAETQGPGTYPVTIVATDNGTPAMAGSAAITISVTEANSAPVLDHIGNKTACLGVPLTFTATATDADVPAQAFTFSLTQGSPPVTGATINPSTGAFSWTPTLGPGAFPVTITVSDNGTPVLTDSEGIVISVLDTCNTPPVITNPGNKTVDELTNLAFTVTATDSDAGQTITFSLGAGAPAGATIGALTGAFSWTPTEAQGPGVYSVTIRATDSAFPPLSDAALISITVNEVPSAPTANAGGPYTGSLNSAVHFDGSGSSDPDGDPLSYAWDFGDGHQGQGVSPAHAYAAVGVYDVSLRVADPGTLFDDDATTATIRSEITVRIALKKDRSTLTLGNDDLVKIAIEQLEFPNADILVSTLRLSTDYPNAGTVSECAADAKFSRTGDLDRNGVPDLEVRFPTACLNQLFQNVPNNASVNLILTGQIETAAGTIPLRGSRVVTLERAHGGAPILASASPNPFNPETMIGYSVGRDGAVTMRIYSIDGRLVRTLMENAATGAGEHEVAWNGKDDRGQQVPSGIYFVRTTLNTGGAEAAAVFKLAVAK